MRQAAAVLAIAAVLLYVLARTGENEAARAHPPAVCQLLGGSWNFWDGWRCG